jgi:hypothetical protein
MKGKRVPSLRARWSRPVEVARDFPSDLRGPRVHAETNLERLRREPRPDDDAIGCCTKALDQLAPREDRSGVDERSPTALDVLVVEGHARNREVMEILLAQRHAWPTAQMP